MNLLFAGLSRWKILILLNTVYAAAGLIWIILIPYNNAPDENTHFHYSVEFIIQHHRLPVWGVDDLDRFRHALSSYNQMPALNYVLYAIGGALANKLFGLEIYLGARLVSLGWGLVFLNFLFLAARELCNSEAAPHGKPRGIFAEPCEAKNAILSCHSSFGATENSPCGKPQGFLAKKGNKNALIVSAAIALIPQVFFSFCYVNGDAHSLAIAAILGLALMRLLRQQTNLNIIFLGAAIGLLFSAKYNYYIYFPGIVVFLLLAVLQRTISWKTIGRLIIASAVLSLLISGYWFIRNAILYGNPLPILLSEDFFKSIALIRDVHPVNHGLNMPALVWLVQNGFIGTTFNSFFAVFGYLNVGFHQEIYIILQFIVPLIAFLFILDLMMTKDRAARIMLAWLLLMIFAVMAMHVWACLTYDYQPQGRYQFAVLVPIALYAGWAITRQVSLWKHAVFFLTMMIWLFIGANILIARTYASPVQFSVSWSGADKSFRPSKYFSQKAKRTEKNFYATEKINLAGDPEVAFLRVGLPEGFLARYRDFKLELETNEGVITNDWSATPPEQLVNTTFNKQLNAFEVCGYDSYFILPLKDITTKVKTVRINCRIENRRLYDLDR